MRLGTVSPLPCQGDSSDVRETRLSRPILRCPLSAFDLLLNEKVVAAALGLVGGAVATFVAPWITWGIERKKLQYQARKETIERWRAMVARISHTSSGDFGNLFLALHDDTDFLSLMPHISEKTQSLLDGGDAMDHEVVEALLADIASMEKRWKIL